MALLAPTVGENLILGMLTNKTAAQDLVLHLFINNITPANTDTAATYTSATFPGYAVANLTGINWNAPAAGSISYSAQQSFACTGVATDDVYGYFVTQVTSGTLVWAERDAAAPFAIRVNGDTVKITPVITAS